MSATFLWVFFLGSVRKTGCLVCQVEDFCHKCRRRVVCCRKGFWGWKKREDEGVLYLASNRSSGPLSKALQVPGLKV